MGVACRNAMSAKLSEQVHFTHTDRVMFPQKGYTKADLLRYYEQVADKLIPHLKDRPLTLERLPAGVSGDKATPHFWQKNTPEHYPSWIARARLLDMSGKPVEYALVNDKRALLYLVNQGTITFHIWLSRVGSLDRPDFVLFDLDPGRRPFADAIKVAREVHRALQARGVMGFPKTSGKSGLHVLAPWTQRGDYDAARAWAREIAEEVAQKLPEVATLERRIAARGGRLYLDVMQNARGHHLVPAYVVRAVPEATVSMPLDWKEMNARLSPGRFDLESALRRFKGKRDLMAALTPIKKTARRHVG
jgi:bifunctional non-homologous end joining protein LigD